MLAAVTDTKLLQEGALAKIGAGLKEPLKLKVNNILVDGDWAAVEMSAVGAVSKQGWPFDNEYCWVCRFDQVISSNIIAQRFVQQNVSGLQHLYTHRRWPVLLQASARCCFDALMHPASFCLSVS